MRKKVYSQAREDASELHGKISLAEGVSRLPVMEEVQAIMNLLRDEDMC